MESRVTLHDVTAFIGGALVNVSQSLVNMSLMAVMGFVLMDKTLAVEQATARYSDLPPSYEEAISTSYYDSPPSYGEAVSTSYYDPPPSYEEAISTSYYSSPPSYEEAISTSYYDPPPSYEEAIGISSYGSPSSGAISTSYYDPLPSREETTSTSSYGSPSSHEGGSSYYDLLLDYAEAISGYGISSGYSSGYGDGVNTSHYGSPLGYGGAINTSYYNFLPRYEETTSTPYYDHLSSYERPGSSSQSYDQFNYEEPTCTTDCEVYSDYDDRPYSDYQLLPSDSGYRKANCGRADDWASHHICCSEPGEPENSVWVAAPRPDWQCVDQSRSNCENDTHIWDNSKKILTQNTMPSYCKARGKGAVLFDGRPPPIFKAND